MKHEEYIAAKKRWCLL